MNKENTVLLLALAVGIVGIVGSLYQTEDNLRLGKVP